MSKAATLNILMGYPKRCLECGGAMKLLGGEGRIFGHREMDTIEISAELKLPTCTTCGEMMIGGVYEELLNKELEECHRRLTVKLTQVAIERIVGRVSQQANNG